MSFKCDCLKCTCGMFPLIKNDKEETMQSHHKLHHQASSHAPYRYAPIKGPEKIKIPNYKRRHMFQGAGLGVLGMSAACTVCIGIGFSHGSLFSLMGVFALVVLFCVVPVVLLSQDS